MKTSQMRVVLTGASGGIGIALAQALNAQGAHLLLIGRSAAKLQALHMTLDTARATVLVADITNPTDREQIRQAAVAMQANVLINNAGLPAFGALQNFPSSEIEQVLQTNLLAPMLLAQSLLPVLLTQSTARLLNIGSTLGRLGLPGFSVYCATKFGLRGFSEALRRELQNSSVRVQYLGPRATQTAFNSHDAKNYQTCTGAKIDSPHTVALAALRLLESGKAERFVGFPERWAVGLNGLTPSSLDKAFRSHAELITQGVFL